MKTNCIALLMLTLCFCIFAEDSKKTQIIIKDYGTFEIPIEFVKHIKHSTPYKDFYIKKGNEELSFTNNISINEGENRYALKDSMLFKDAIQRQLLMQMQSSNAQLNGSGGFTKKGHTLFKFEIIDVKYTTRQYYIVGDYKFILIHETISGDSIETDKATQLMVDSFEWSK